MDKSMGRKEGEIGTDGQLTGKLGVAIRAWRRYSQLSVTELAVQAGFGEKGRGYISKIEHGQIHHVGDDRLDNIAAALHLTSTDLLLHRMPETQAAKQVESLDKAIVGCKALLRIFPYGSLNWARMHFKLAELYWKHSLFSSDAAARGQILTEAHQSIEHALSVFTEENAPRTYKEAAQLRSEIQNTIEKEAINGCKVLLEMFPDGSFDWARIQFGLAELYWKHAPSLSDAAARGQILTEAHQSIEHALSVFTEEKTPNSYEECVRLRLDIRKAQRKNQSE